MTTIHKNKTISCLLSSTLGASGAHRFYLYGMRDFWAWTHFIATLCSLMAIMVITSYPDFFLALPLIFSIISGFIEALVIGLTSDEKWDNLHNCQSEIQSRSRWPLALLLVVIFGVGAVTMIGTIARTFDLLYSEGAFG